MNEEKMNELKKYINPKSWGLCIVGVVFLAMAVFLIASGAVTEGGKSLFAVAIFLLGGVGMFWSGISGHKEYKTKMAELENSGELGRLLSDFGAAQSFVDGKIRLGQTYIFGKGQGHWITYGEIRQVYQYVHKKNFVENGRQLRCVNSQGKTLTLCDLKLKGKSDEDVYKIVAIIKTKNPGVIIGYNK